MKLFRLILVALALGVAAAAPRVTRAQSNATQLDALELRLAKVERQSADRDAAAIAVANRLGVLEGRASRLEHATDNGALGIAVFVCAAFCALWAQQTGRSAWRWFFLGLLFTVVALVVLLYKNSNDRRRKTVAA